MARYDNKHYSAEMPPGYGPRDLLKLLTDTARDGEKDAAFHTPQERFWLFRHRERLASAMAQLTASHSIGQRRRANLSYQALESACVILSLRIEQNVVQRQMKARADHARDSKKPVGRKVDEILITLATPIRREHRDDTPFSVAGKIRSKALDVFEADEQLKARKQLPREQQAIERRLKKLWHLIT
jgi:hypothetical protein